MIVTNETIPSVSQIERIDSMNFSYRKEHLIHMFKKQAQAPIKTDASSVVGIPT